MTTQARYLTDDRDLCAEGLRELVITLGGNGDWYVAVVPAGGIPVEGVRICTSGGASTRCPGLAGGVAEAYRAIRTALGDEIPEDPTYQDLLAEVTAWRLKVPGHHYDPLLDEIAPRNSAGGQSHV